MSSLYDTLPQSNLIDRGALLQLKSYAYVSDSIKELLQLKSMTNSNAMPTNGYRILISRMVESKTFIIATCNKNFKKDTVEFEKQNIFNNIRRKL